MEHDVFIEKSIDSIDELIEVAEYSSQLKNPKSIVGCCQDCACEDRTCN